ncbi:tannase/feruloyl esterase family alpha/beta hydrolase [Nocardioides luteus]|uniref:tannase/feruloyl esterase family alpha/beta hydrolase n=1 Tax=Nocardioides luteus TaxID=1844 RepID=UPI0018CBB544|nr:tannase/feruloyl esterase family alpha/beta hydrolase [Nocardioides luteus]MBG6096793.1 hypothetical protein [Nocardioides luteus]
MKRLLLVVAGLPLAAALTTAHPGAAAAEKPPAVSGSATPRSAGCEAPDLMPPRDARIVSVSATAKPGGTLTYPPQPGASEPPPPVTGVPSYCQVDVTLTHGTAGDRELIQVWLPTTGWNGRFQALGGSGYLGGDFGPSLPTAVKAGYAVGTTDAGATPTTGFTADWALTDDGRVNTTVLKNFAERGPHELAVLGKAITKDFYGRAAHHAYWNGCSTGGRQGYMEAQRHPGDFDGILAAAPAISWDRFAVGDLWPYVVMNEEDNHLSPCELNAFTAAAREACDNDDGVVDGIVGDSISCDFDPASLVSEKVLCDGQELTITAGDAAVVEKIWGGPRAADGKRLWFGLTPSADLGYLAGPAPFPVASSWVQNLLVKDPSFDVSTITYADYERLFAQSVEEYHQVIGSDDTDLSGLRRAGTKLLTWHGGDDQLVPLAGTLSYRDKVARRFGDIDDFYRVFVAPGASHCQAGVGPAPKDPLGALVAWVEKGHAPATLAATSVAADGTTVERDICLYPRTSHLSGGAVTCR